MIPERYGTFIRIVLVNLILVMFSFCSPVTDYIHKLDVNRLIRKLESKDPAVRKEAAEHLYFQLTIEPYAPAGEPLIAVLEDTDRDVRYYASSALGVLKDRRAVESLISIQRKDESLSVRQSSVRALGEIGDSRAVEPLLLNLEDADFGIRSFSIGALGQIGDTRALKPIIEALNNRGEHPGVRISAVKALAHFEDDISLTTLIDATEDEEEQIHRFAITSLAEKKDPRAVGALLKIVKNEQSYLRNLALWSLGKIKDPCAAIHLIKELDSKNPKTSERARRSLERIAGKDLGKESAKWRQWWMEEIKDACEGNQGLNPQ